MPERPADPESDWSARRRAWEAGPVERACTVETGRTDREANMWAFTRAALELLEACLIEDAR